MCIEKGILSEFFSERYDVMKMIQLDYTFERRIELQKEESYSEGHADGRKEGIAEGKAEGQIKGKDLLLIEQVCKKLKKGKDIPTIADELEEDVAHISVICSAAEKYAPDYDAEKIFADINA